MKDLFVEDRAVEQEALLSARETRWELSQVENELELFRFAQWGLFRERLTILIERDLESLVRCPLEEVPAKRARIEAHRHLLGVEAELRRRGAELRAALAAPEEDHE